jgi:RNA polymerase sigma factor for flagellar operon FliA
MEQAADERRTEYILEHLELVDAIAASIIRRLPPSFELDDLKSAGKIGLIRAAARYNRAMNVPFGAYARHRIRGEILEACRRRNWRENTHDELYPESRDERTVDVDMDFEIRAEERTRLLERVLSGLSGEHQMALRIYYLEHRTLNDVGGVLGLSSCRAGQIVRQALAAARREMALNGIKAA